jgi:hypothetical protein
MSIAQTNIQYDTMKIMVTKPDQNIYKMAMLKPGTQDYVKTDNIISGCSPDDLKAVIKGFYTDLYDVEPLVTSTFYDGSGSVTTEDSGTVNSITYMIQTPTALAAASVDNIFVLPITTSSTIEVVYPSVKQLSSPPLSGKFFVECHDVTGQAYTTHDMELSISAASF